MEKAYEEKVIEMEDLRIRLYGDPVLRGKSAQVLSFDESIRSLTSRMIEIMFEHDGLGLAAPQVGVLKRVAIVLREEKPLILINPEILEVSDELVEAKEGCLSFPDIYEIIKRPAGVRIKAFNLDGEEFELEEEGIVARAVLHELDHLDGKLLIDYLSPARKALVKSRMRKLWRR